MAVQPAGGWFRTISCPLVLVAVHWSLLSEPSRSKVFAAIPKLFNTPPASTGDEIDDMVQTLAWAQGLNWKRRSRGREGPFEMFADMLRKTENKRTDYDRIATKVVATLCFFGSIFMLGPPLFLIYKFLWPVTRRYWLVLHRHGFLEVLFYCLSLALSVQGCRFQPSDIPGIGSPWWAELFGWIGGLAVTPCWLYSMNLHRPWLEGATRSARAAKQRQQAEKVTISEDTKGESSDGKAAATARAGSTSSQGGSSQLDDEEERQLLGIIMPALTAITLGAGLQAAALVPLAIVLMSPRLGFLAVFAAHVALSGAFLRRWTLGSSTWTFYNMFLAWASASACVAIVVLYVRMRFDAPSPGAPPPCRLFAQGAAIFGNLFYFIDVVALSVWQEHPASYAFRQILVVASLVLSLWFGWMWDAPGLSNCGYTFVILWLVAKECELNQKVSNWNVLLKGLSLLGVVMYAFMNWDKVCATIDPHNCYS